MKTFTEPSAKTFTEPSAKTFQRTVPVRFRHCDPAGIVFYPRYFEMMNDLLEDFFEELGAPFATIHGARGEGVPTVALEASFMRPSVLGDALELTLWVTQIGASSFSLAYRASCAGEARFEARSTLVYVAGAARGEVRSRPIPQELRAGLKAFLQEGP